MGQREKDTKENGLTQKILNAENRVKNYSDANTSMFYSHEKRRMAQAAKLLAERAEPHAQRIELGARRAELWTTEIIPRPWNWMNFCQFNLTIAWNQWWLSLFHPHHYFWMAIPITVILCLPHHCVLGSHNLIFIFTDRSTAREEFCLRWILIESFDPYII